MFWRKFLPKKQKSKSARYARTSGSYRRDKPSMLYVTKLARVVVGTGLQLPSPIWARPIFYSVAPADCVVFCWLWCALFICIFRHGLCQCQLPLFPFAHHWTTQPLLGPTTASLNTVKSALHVRFFARLLGRQVRDVSTLRTRFSGWPAVCVMTRGCCCCHLGVFQSGTRARCSLCICKRLFSIMKLCVAVSCGGVLLWRVPVCCVVFLMGSLCVFHCLVTSGRCLCRLPPSVLTSSLPVSSGLSGVGCALSLRKLPFDCRKVGGP